MACYVNSQPDIGGGGLQMELITTITKDQEYTMQDKWIVDLQNSEYILIYVALTNPTKLSTQSAYEYGSCIGLHQPSVLHQLLQQSTYSNYISYIADTPNTGSSAGCIAAQQSKFKGLGGLYNNSFTCNIYGIKGSILSSS